MERDEAVGALRDLFEARDKMRNLIQGGYDDYAKEAEEAFVEIRERILAALTGSDGPMKSKEPYTHEAIPLDSGRVYILPINHLASDPPLTDEQQVIKYLWEKLKALTGSERPEVDLHGAIMNIQVDEKLLTQAIGYATRKQERMEETIYRLAFRDARHAAAEIVAGTWRKVSP